MYRHTFDLKYDVYVTLQYLATASKPTGNQPGFN